jgi:hypothetical protein
MALRFWKRFNTVGITDTMDGLGSSKVPGVLEDGENHPSTESASLYIQEHWLTNIHRLASIQNAMASTHNRTSEICQETLKQLMNNETVSDRYLLGLAWTLIQIENKERENDKKTTTTE